MNRPRAPRNFDASKQKSPQPPKRHKTVPYRAIWELCLPFLVRHKNVTLNIRWQRRRRRHKCLTFMICYNRQRHKNVTFMICYNSISASHWMFRKKRPLERKDLTLTRCDDTIYSVARTNRYVWIDLTLSGDKKKINASTNKLDISAQSWYNIPVS